MAATRIEDREHLLEVHNYIRSLLEGESRRPSHSGLSNATICMVPDTLRKLNAKAYTPRITSIGPLHKEDERLKAMEEHKVTYMYRLFHRVAESTEMDMAHIRRKCVKAMFGLVTRTRACYAQSFTNYGDSEVAEMMVIEGCFILELLCTFRYGAAEDDRIFHNILVLHDIKIDLLLLENQIPFFLLEVLFRLTLQRLPSQASLNELLLHFFKDMNILNNTDLSITSETVEQCHILGLFQSCYGDRATKAGVIPTIAYNSATEIDALGVTFKAQRNANSPLAVKFNQSSFTPCLVTCVSKTCFKIPELRINDFTPSLLGNLVAYEQCYHLSRNYVTSFSFLMYKLINNKDDVSLLVRSKVLQHSLGASEDITSVFKNICNGVVLQDFYYTEEWRQLDEHCKRFWPSLCVTLTRLYESAPWKTITLIAGVIIFTLTLVKIIHNWH